MIREPYFSIFGIIVVIIAVGFILRMSDNSNILGVIEGIGQVDPVPVAQPISDAGGAFKFNSSSGVDTGSLEVSTELVIDKDGVMFLTLPKEMKVPDIKKLAITTTTTITSSPSGATSRYMLEGVTNLCDSDDLGDLLSGSITHCAAETKIKIIMGDTSTINDFTVAQPVSFKLSGLYTPTATPVKFEIRTDKMVISDDFVTIPGVTTSSMAEEFLAKTCEFKLTLTDDTPEATDVTVKYDFSFTPPSAFKIKSGSKLYFLYSDDFTLPNPGDIKIAVNGYTVLDPDKGEYTLKSKEKCTTPSKSELDLLKDMGANFNFESEIKLCTKYYVLELRKDIVINESGKLVVSLIGMTNPPYYPNHAPEGKRDYLVKPFNTTLCIMLLDTNKGGKVLINPVIESYANIGIYFRGNYPVKNKKSKTGYNDDNAMDIHGDDAAENRSKQSRPSATSRAANVYTVNYFYDGQGAGEYGYIARPDIFGTTPYSYDSGRGGLGSSDKYLAKQYRDLEEKKRMQKQQQQEQMAHGAVGQIAPPMGVAPSSLDGGIQPYNSEIRF